jgi:hypothetical protein
MKLMGKSKVIFTDMRTKPGMGILDKLERVVRKAGIESIDFKFGSPALTREQQTRAEIAQLKSR